VTEKLLSVTQLKLLTGLMEEMAEKCKLVSGLEEKHKISDIIEKNFGLKVYEPELLNEKEPAVLLDEKCKAYLYIP
jgi:hypothetical protein